MHQTLVKMQREMSVLHSFLQRVGIYYLPAECDSFIQQVSPPVSPANKASNRNRRCLACNPQKIKPMEVCMVEHQNMFWRMGWEGYVEHNRENKDVLTVDSKTWRDLSEGRVQHLILQDSLKRVDQTYKLLASTFLKNSLTLQNGGQLWVSVMSIMILDSVTVCVLTTW